MTIARVDGTTVLEQRALQLSDVPEHKRHLWVPVVYEGDGPITQTIVEPTQVRIVRSERPLATIKAEYSARVDADAGNVRGKYLTAGAGMEMTYAEKHAQARAVAAMGETDANALTEAERDDQFPTLSASVGLEAQTLYGCAQLVIQKYEQFADLSRIIERTRLQGKKSISDASDAVAVRAAYEAIQWTV